MTSISSAASDGRLQTRLGATSLVPTRTTRDFDSAYAAAMAGYPDRDTYYAQCSCGPHLGNIRVPTVILSSRDDPFAPAGDIFKQALSSSVHLHVEHLGGHMGYVSGNLSDQRWLDYALEHYLNEFQASQKSQPASQRPEPIAFSVAPFQNDR